MKLKFEETFDVDTKILFDWHRAPAAFERLSPPWEKVKLKSRIGDISSGTVELLLSFVGVPISWKLEHYNYQEGAVFNDRQLSGPFRSWQHSHRFASISDNRCLLSDQIEFQLPLFSVSFLESFFAKKLESLFRYRHKVTKNDLLRQAQFENLAKKHFLISGATGMVGTALVHFLLNLGAKITLLSRSANHSLKYLPLDTIVWNPECADLNLGDNSFDYVVHLAGQNVSSGIWTSAFKKQIYNSRINSTKVLVSALAKLKQRPIKFISASAVGYYGDRPEQRLSEEAGAGQGFLAETCIDWEKQALTANELGIKTALCRFGLLLSSNAGALSKMLPAFKLGLGATLGSGRQQLSWMHLDDVIYAICFLASNHELDGAFNFTAPNPCTNLEFSKTLANVLQRPMLFSAPEIFLNLVFKEFADQALLASTAATPDRLLKAGFSFSYPDLREALSYLTGSFS